MRKPIALLVIATVMSLSAMAPAQDLTKLVSPASDEARPRTVKKAPGKEAVAANESTSDARPVNPTEALGVSDEAAIQAQIKYPYGASVEDAMEKLRYDLYYIKNQNLLLDAGIIFETVKTVLFGRGGR